MDLKDNDKVIPIDTYLLYIILQNNIKSNENTSDKDYFIKIFINNFSENYIFQNNLSKIELIINNDELLYKELYSINKKIKELFKKIYKDYVQATILNKDHVI